MTPFEPASLPLHYQAAGNGPIVVCLHSSGGSSTQSRSLVDAGHHGYRFMAFDFYGHGRSPEYVGPAYRLEEDSEAVLRSLPIGVPIHLVGHSYGGAVALDLAVRHAERFASVTVFEPVLFGLLPRDSWEWREITAIGMGIARSARDGQIDAACIGFVDYWNGSGAWSRLAAVQQQRVRERIVPVARHFEALFADPLPIERLRDLQCSTLVLCGAGSPAPARAVCARLHELPFVRLGILPDAAHMGPITHAQIVNRQVLAHLEVQAKAELAA